MSDQDCTCFNTYPDQPDCPVCTPVHRRRMDEYERARNRELLTWAEAILARPTGTWVEQVRAEALLARFAECEIARLNAKARWLR